MYHKNPFMRSHLPYCVQKMDDERWVVVNRDYKPLGFFTDDFIKYEDHPVLHSYKKLTPVKIAQIATTIYEDRFYLYDDGSYPLDSDELWAAYCERLHILARITGD